jgi:hypothetical protein
MTMLTSPGQGSGALRAIDNPEPAANNVLTDQFAAFQRAVTSAVARRILSARARYLPKDATPPQRLYSAPFKWFHGPSAEALSALPGSRAC